MILDKAGGSAILMVSMAIGIIQESRLSLPHGAALPVAILNRGAAGLEFAMPYKDPEVARIKGLERKHRYLARKHMERWGHLEDMRGRHHNDSGPVNGRWNSSQMVSSHGYVVVRAPIGCPHAFNRGKYVYEHILIAERNSGRSLLPSETAHHLNCDKTDNRPENVIVMSRSNHMRLHALIRRNGKAIYPNDPAWPAWAKQEQP